MIEINRDPTRRQLRSFAGLVFPLFCAWLALLAHRAGVPLLTQGLLGLAVVAAIAGLVSLRVARWLWLGTMYAVFPIGWVLSHVLLAIVYYGVLTPIGLVMRLVGQDPMKRRFAPEATTYWEPHEPPPDAERYFRQY